MHNLELKKHCIDSDDDFHYLSQAVMAKFTPAEQMLYCESLKGHWDFFSFGYTRTIVSEVDGARKQKHSPIGLTARPGRRIKLFSKGKFATFGNE